MRQQLMSLALTVDQHESGAFFWVILESFDRSSEFVPLVETAVGFATYVEALDAGLASLKKMSVDLDAGPQEEVEDEDEDDEAW